MKPYSKIAATVSLLALASAANAVVIDFTGGTAYFNGGGSGVTANGPSYSNVDYYEEGGFSLDFVGGVGFPFSAHVGDYYGAGNDVIHSHWDTGDFGTITLVTGTKIGGGPFDLNYFILTSNTDTGGSTASGLEKAYITHDGGFDPILLPPEDWGFPATQIFLPASYDGIFSFEFHVENPVDCFGMDEFYIDEPAPPAVPDAGSALPLLAIGFAAVAGFRARIRS